MEIYVFRGEWDLASIDFDCLRVLTYIKFCEFAQNVEKPIEIITNSNPVNSPNGFLPYLKDGNKKFASYEKIINYLKTEKKYVLPETSSSSSEAYMSFLLDNLSPFFRYMQWGHPQNLEETRMLYAKRIPFPFNFYCPRKYVLKTNELTQTLANFSIDDPITSHETSTLNMKAKKCLNWIAEKLSTPEWQKRLETTPSEFDATLYAYLAIISRQKLPDSQLQAHAKQCDNLIKYVETITKKYFKPSERFETADKKPQSSGSEEKPKEEKKFFDGTEQEEDPKEVRNRYILSGLVAFSVMSFYAVFVGLFKFASADDMMDQDFRGHAYDDEDE